MIILMSGVNVKVKFKSSKTGSSGNGIVLAWHFDEEMRASVATVLDSKAGMILTIPQKDISIPKMELNKLKKEAAKYDFGD